MTFRLRFFFFAYGHPIVPALLQEEGPLPGPESGLLTFGNELFKETHLALLTKQDILMGRGTWAESRRVREPRRTALPHG